MKISVAIPTYNRGDLICQTIDSILNQTVKVDEIVIVDDGSTDNTEDVISKYGEKIRYKKMANAGPAAARASAISLCSGDWIALCDSDDLWLPQHIENFLRFNELFPSANVCFMNFGILGEKDSDKFSEAPENWWDKATLQLSEDNRYALLNDDTYESLLKFQPIFQTALFFRLSLYNQIGGISAKISRMNSEDAHLTRRLVAYGQTGCCKEISVDIRKHEGNYSKDFIENLKGRKTILEYLIAHNEIPKRFISSTKTEIELANLIIFRNLYWAGKFQDAQKIFTNIKINLITFNDIVRYLKVRLSNMVSKKET
jgi:glycosyltransferase involved in cell wall biosynthesis